MSRSMDELIDATFLALCAAEGYDPLITDDVLVLGTDPHEWWEGRAVVDTAMEEQLEQLGTATMEPEGDRRVRERGDVAWFAEHARIGFGDQLFRVRMSGVAVREDGDWRFAQLQAAAAEQPLPVSAQPGSTGR